MTEGTVLDQVEFIRLGGHPVRVTSIRKAAGTGAWTIVTITRGSRDADLLRTLLAETPLVMDIPGHSPVEVAVTDLDVRVSGDGAAQVARFALTLQESASDAAPVPPQTLDQRLAALEAQVARLQERLDALGQPARYERRR